MAVGNLLLGRRHLSLRTLALLLTGFPAAVPADDAEPLVFRELDGAERRLSEYRGKVVVLNFWATWCIPCREEMPLLAGIQKRYAERGVVVIGASADDESTASEIPGFVRKIGITFPVWKGATTEHMRALGLGTGLPVTAILDQNGQVGFRLLGVIQKRDLETRLEFLLGDQGGRRPAALVDRLSEHGGEERHNHGGVGMEGASTVPS